MRIAYFPYVEELHELVDELDELEPSLMETRHQVLARRQR